MKRAIFSLLLVGLVSISYSQISVGSDSPTSASILYLEALNVKTTSYGGFLMPIVTEVQQASIPVSTTDDRDDGLMVYVSDPITGKHCWDIYDSVADVWRSITCQSVASCSTILFQEDFNSYAENTGVTGVSSSNGDYPSSVTKWTLTSFLSFGVATPNLPGTLADANDYGLVKSGALECRDTNGAFRLETESIDITGYSDIIIGMDVWNSGDFEYDIFSHVNDFDCGNTNSDYFDVEYSIDGGAFIEVPNFSTLGTAHHTIIFDETFASDGSLINFSTSLTGLSASTLVLRLRLQNWSSSEYIYIDNIVVRCN